MPYDLVFWVRLDVDVADYPVHLVSHLRNRDDLRAQHRTMLRAGPSGGCCWGDHRPLYNEQAKPKVIRYIARTYLVIFNILNLIVTALLQIGNTPTLFVFRLLQGVIAGVYMNFIPAYISEITPKELGSRYGVYPQISVVLGVLVSFTVGMIMTDAFGFENLPGNIPVE